MDVHIISNEFHRKIAVPFLNALLSKIEAAFDMESTEPVQALLTLDPTEITTADDASFVIYGSEKIKISFSFYGKERSDHYAGSTVTSPALILCTAEFLILQNEIVELGTKERKP